MPTESINGLGQIDEESTSYVRMDFLNQDEVLEQPVSGTYTIHDFYTNKVLKSDTWFQAPSGTFEATILPSENVIINPELPTEIRVLTAKGYYNTEDQVTGRFRWEVLNLSYLP